MIGGILLAAFIIGLRVHLSKQYLVLMGENNQIYQKLPISENEEFSIEFVHSVNQSPVIDYYKVAEGEIYVTATKYYGFGAGVQTELKGNETLTYTEDNGMLITGINQKMEHLTYVVGMVSDHVLHYRGQRISLKEVCNKGAMVEFIVQQNLRKRRKYGKG